MAKPSKDRRSLPRHRAIATAWLSSQQDPTGITLEGELLNVSFRGAALRIANEVPVGDSVHITFHPSDQSTIRVFASVRHVNTEPDGAFCVGCQFARDLSAAELVALTASEAAALN